MNKRDIPPEKLSQLLQMAGNDPKLQQSLRRGDFEGAIRSLPPKDAQTVRSILSDPKQLQSVLASPEAQKLIQQIKKGK